MQKWFSYILRCADNSLYTGITTDLERRVKTHNDGKGAKYTRAKKPVRLVYHETHQSHEEAAKREAELKSWKKEKKEELIREKGL